jgi:hypothetical protein
MKERIDPILEEQWERTLKAEGLSKIEKSQKIPTKKAGEFVRDDSASVNPNLLSEASQEILQKYSTLPSKIQDDIYDDLEQHQRAGMKFKEVSDRLNLLVAKGVELASLTSEDSDKYYKPRPTPEEIKLNGEVEKLLEELRKRRKIESDEDDIEKAPDENIIEKEGEKEEEKKQEPPKDWIN